jgi:hypothetical protein
MAPGARSRSIVQHALYVYRNAQARGTRACDAGRRVARPALEGVRTAF